MGLLWFRRSKAKEIRSSGRSLSAGRPEPGAGAAAAAWTAAAQPQAERRSRTDRERRRRSDSRDEVIAALQARRPGITFDADGRGELIGRPIIASASISGAATRCMPRWRPRKGDTAIELLRTADGAARLARLRAEGRRVRRARRARSVRRSRTTGPRRSVRRSGPYFRSSFNRSVLIANAASAPSAAATTTHCTARDASPATNRPGRWVVSYLPGPHRSFVVELASQPLEQVRALILAGREEQRAAFERRRVLEHDPRQHAAGAFEARRRVPREWRCRSAPAGRDLGLDLRRAVGAQAPDRGSRR